MSMLERPPAQGTWSVMDDKEVVFEYFGNLADGTVQQVSEPESIYSWMSDDYLVVEAVDEEGALRKARLAE